MGHVRLGELPRSRPWQQVINLLDSGAETAQVAAVTLDAAKRGLADAAGDPALVRSFWLLTQLPQLARRENYLSELNRVGITVASEPTVLELVGGFAGAIDEHLLRRGGRTDLGEIAQMGATESLNAALRHSATSIFGSTPEMARSALAGMATRKQFAILARDFFARLTEKYLAYFLSRATSSYLPGVPANREFREALHLHCRQASLIVETFAGEWYSKNNYQGGISERKAAVFVDVALGKLRKELEKGAVGGGR